MNTEPSTFILNIAFSISVLGCLLNLTLNSLIVLERLLVVRHFQSFPISGAFLTLSVFELTLLILGLHCSFRQRYKLPISFWFVCYRLLLHSPWSLHLAPFLILWLLWDTIILLITLYFLLLEYSNPLLRVLPSYLLSNFEANEILYNEFQLSQN